MPPESQLSDGAIILGGIIGGAFLKVFPWMRKRWGKKQVTKAKRGYAGIGQLLDQLTEARRAVGASRVLFIVSRNSGGLPLPGVPVKVSVHYESAADGVRLIHSEWQDWPADSATIETLTDLAASGGARVDLVREEMHPGAVRTLYERDGVAASACYLVGHVPTGNWMAFVAFEFQDSSGLVENGRLALNVVQRDILRAAVGRIRGVLRQYHEVIV